MDNHIILRTVLIVLAAAVLFSLVYYYNTKQGMNEQPLSPAAAPSPATMEKFYQERNNPTERFYQQSTPSAIINNVPTTNFESPRVVENTQRNLSFQPDDDVKNTNLVQPSNGDMTSEYRSVDFAGQKLPNDCFPKDRLTTEDLLPKDAANLKWSAVNPAGQGDVSNINFVQAGAMLGINSTLGSMRNANLQLRSDPVIPNQAGDWPIMMSTIPRNSSLLRKPLEISGDCGEL